MEQLGSHWTDFHDILYFEYFFENPSPKIQVSLKSYKNNGSFTCRPMYIFIMSRPVSLRMTNALHKNYRENQNPHFMLITFFSRALYEIMWKNMVKPDSLQMTI